MGDFKTIETQEELDALINERLEQEREVIQKKYEGYLSPEAVVEKYNGYLSPEEAAKKDAKIKSYETEAVKARIAREMGLSSEAAGFLLGEDEKAIRKSAEALKSLVSGTNLAPLASNESSVGDAKDVAYKNMLKGLKGE